jgi:NAD(P)-dependent dehydrogenase (short-subunit alcohol dehydrogenase family)
VLELGGVDLTDPAAAQTAIDRVAAHFGRLDALLNIAGGFVWQTTDDADPAWAKMFALNVATALNASRAALPHLKASAEGRIVNVGANAALKSAAGMGAYAASKAGVHRLTESLAEELKDTSVTVNAVLPSILDTARNRQDMPDADPAKWVAPADLARVMLFLASPGSRAITGALIPVTGRV